MSIPEIELDDSKVGSGSDSLTPELVSKIKKLNRINFFDYVNGVGTVSCVVAFFTGHYIAAAVLFIGFTPTVEDLIVYKNRIKNWIARKLMERLQKKLFDHLT